MASVALDLLIGKVASILETEVLLIGGVRDELDELKRELTSMRSFLKDADTETDLSEVEKARVANVRDMCYPVEDIMEEFIYHMNKPYPEEGGKFLKPLYQMIRIPKNLWVKHRVATKLQAINKKIKSIPEISQRYRVSHIEGTGSRGGDDDAQRRRLQNQSEALVYAKDDHFVGIEDDTRQLVKWLTQGESGLTAISVVGMGGSGKTTLVSKVYNTHAVKQHFHCYAWITVSERYDVEDLLRRMIKEFYSSCENNNVPADLSSKTSKELHKILLDYLSTRRYVVVFDDVWTDKLWREIEFAVPDEGLGSRVILTTRIEQVASSFLVCKSYVHPVKPLELSEAWILFCSNAFSTNPNKSCPEELQAVARQLVAKCRGLPLAILALGGLMSSKKQVHEWNEINHGLNQELISKDDLVKSILLRSFIDLPFQNKCCFLYCCIFPEDYFIKRKRVIRLWMAEGFVADHHQQRATRTPEQVADGYLMELVRRNMLHVVRRNHEGRPKVLKMHDLMRELALSRSEEENLCTVYVGREASEEEISRARRLSIQLSATEELVTPANHRMSQIRSLFVFIAGIKRPFDYTWPSSFRVLRVLDLEDVPITNLPDNIVDLFNLRYLNLESTFVKELPKSIGRLSNLQTLRIRGTGIEVLPTGITKLLKLRHLSMASAPWPVPSSISKLNNLQVLDCVEAEPALMKQLKDMTQLTRIGITNLREADEVNLCNSIGRMNHLRQLFLKAANDEYLRINALPRAPPCLRKMVLVGKLDGVPRWFGSPQNLLSLHLIGSKLSEDLITHLQALPNLAELVLNDAWEGNQLCFSAGFSKLKDLRFEVLPQLNEVIILKGVMPGLLKLSFKECTQLKMLPCGSGHVTNIELIRHLTHLEVNGIGLPPGIAGLMDLTLAAGPVGLPLLAGALPPGASQMESQMALLQAAAEAFPAAFQAQAEAAEEFQAAAAEAFQAAAAAAEAEAAAMVAEAGAELDAYLALPPQARAELDAQLR